MREELRERGIKQKDFAKQIGMQATHLSEFIRGKRNLNDDLAMKLENHLGIPYKTWRACTMVICMTAKPSARNNRKNKLHVRLRTHVLVCSILNFFIRN